ncbi:hypothetical protein CULCOIPH005_03520 [Corynebacterium ulcerans]|uniref:Uncharacterized protein n=1 Tax=Corynebacterium ulcerans TaxID=65058 RepID=A0ABD0BJM0_CORUL|nr:hypothetical protein [Corynebacterium ulcerans]GJJ42163.1 hypothetical protein CULCOIPH005_03520 [Corynebacterium ulcerans]
MKKLVSTVVSCAIAGSILTAPVAGAQGAQIDELLIMRHSNGSPSVTVSCSADSKKSAEERIRQCKDASINLLADALLNADKLAREQEEKLRKQSERFSEIARLFETEQVYNRFLESLIGEGIDLINQLISKNHHQQQKIHALADKLNTSNKRLEDAQAENQELQEYLQEGLDILDEQNEIIEEQDRTIEGLLDRIEDLQDDNEALGEENDALREDYKKALDALKKSLEESKELAEKNQALKNQLANAQSKIEELEKKYAEAQRDILGLKNDNKRLEDLNKKNLDKLGETEGKLNTASILATDFGVISAIAAIIGIGGFLKPIIDRFFHHR